MSETSSVFPGGLQLSLSIDTSNDAHLAVLVAGGASALLAVGGGAVGGKVARSSAGGTLDGGDAHGPSEGDVSGGAEQSLLAIISASAQLSNFARSELLASSLSSQRGGGQACLLVGLSASILGLVGVAATCSLAEVLLATLSVGAVGLAIVALVIAVGISGEGALAIVSVGLGFAVSGFAEVSVSISSGVGGVVDALQVSRAALSRE